MESYILIGKMTRRCANTGKLETLTVYGSSSGVSQYAPLGNLYNVPSELELPDGANIINRVIKQSHRAVLEECPMCGAKTFVCGHELFCFNADCMMEMDVWNLVHQLSALPIDAFVRENIDMFMRDNPRFVGSIYSLCKLNGFESRYLEILRQTSWAARLTMVGATMFNMGVLEVNGLNAENFDRIVKSHDSYEQTYKQLTLLGVDETVSAYIATVIDSNIDQWQAAVA